MTEPTRTELVATDPNDHALVAQTSLFIATADGIIAPAFAQGAAVDYLDTGRYVKPPRLRIVQGASAPELKAQFHNGSVVAVPNMIQIAPVMLNAAGMPSEDGTPFDFIPIFTYTEFLIWNPMQSKGKLTPIRDRSFDQTSEIALRARDFKNPQAREFACPEMPEYKCRCQEHINFVLMVLEGDMYLKPMVMSFSRTSFKAGTALISLWHMRNTQMYACIFTMQSKLQIVKDNSWYTPMIRNPLPEPIGHGPWVMEEEIFRYGESQYKYFKEIYDMGLLVTEYDDDSTPIDPNSNFDQLQSQQEDLTKAKY